MAVEVFENRKIERIERETIDISFSKRKSKARGIKGRLLGDLQKARNDGNMLLAGYIQSLLVDFERFHSKAEVRLKSWKGKSGFHIIIKPDSFDIVRYRKKDQDSEPQEVIRNILKEDVNTVLKALYLAKNKTAKEKIQTREIAREYCILSNLNENNHNRLLFEGEEFIWDNFFSDRVMHTFLNDILDLLDYYNIICYRAGKSQILRKVGDIQLILK